MKAERKKQASMRKRGTAKGKGKTMEWLSEEQKPYIDEGEWVRPCLGRYGFSAENRTVDSLLEWIVINVPMNRSSKILTGTGMTRAEELFGNRREYSLEDWALLRPGWWSTIEEKRERSNCTQYDFWMNKPPDISGVTIPAVAEHWWNKYIEFKGDKETDPRRRCAYMVVAGLLPNPFNEGNLIRFAAGQIENPNPDTRYAEWGLTEDGWEELAKRKRNKTVTTKPKGTKRGAPIKCPDRKLAVRTCFDNGESPQQILETLVLFERLVLFQNEFANNPQIDRIKQDVDKWKATIDTVNADTKHIIDTQKFKKLLDNNKNNSVTIKLFNKWYKSTGT